MINFGYKALNDRQINLDEKNLELSKVISEKEPTFNICITCGTCSATCTAAKYTDFSLHRIIILIKRGEISGIDTLIKKCMFCGKCQLACPRNVNTRSIVLNIQKLITK